VLSARENTELHQAFSLVPRQQRHVRLDFAEQRAAHRTRLVHHTKVLTERANSVQVSDFSSVAYESAVGSLHSWFGVAREPKLRSGSGDPLLVYVHGGSQVQTDDFLTLEQFRRAGFAVALPTFRAEEGNPGDFEMLYGELDDLAAAVNSLRFHSGVDPSRVAVFGVHSGGVLSGMLSLMQSPRVSMTGSVGGFAGEELFESASVPFENSEIERRLRLFAPTLFTMQQPHWACVSVEDTAKLVKASDALEDQTGDLLKVHAVPNALRHSASACIGHFLEAVSQEFGVTSAVFRSSLKD
jgi:hypothetical protein